MTRSTPTISPLTEYLCGCKYPSKYNAYHDTDCAACYSFNWSRRHNAKCHPTVKIKTAIPVNSGESLTNIGEQIRGRIAGSNPAVTTMRFES